MDTVWKMPVRDRKFFINKHNLEVEMKENKAGGSTGTTTFSTPDALNEFARTQTAYQRIKDGKN